MIQFLYSDTHTYFLTVLIFWPLVGALIIKFINVTRPDIMRSVAMFFSLSTLAYAMFLWIVFDKASGMFQFTEVYRWLPFYNMDFYLAVDGISLFFIILTTFLIPMCILISWEFITKNVREYLLILLILEALLILIFTVLDIVLFYVFYESVLLPMFLLIGIWGTRQRKIHAAIQFFLYTLVGSLAMLIAITIIYLTAGTTNIVTLSLVEFSHEAQTVLWIAFFAAFAVKIPMIPVHIWLPEAHVEAPTAGSVLLAGILLKLGGYGFLRLSMMVFPNATMHITPIIFTICIIGGIFSAFSTLRQTDFKKVIAYTSVAHMAFVVVGMFSCTSIGIEGAVFLMLSHGIVSSALFIVVGILYDRHHTKTLKYYCGIMQGTPIYGTAFLFLSLANMGLPATGNFSGEYFILTGAIFQNTVLTTMISTALVLGAAYSIWVFNKLSAGTAMLKGIKFLFDATRREIFVLIPFILLTLIMGIYPEIFIDQIHSSIRDLLSVAKV